MPSLTTLTKPPLLFSRSAVLSKPCPVPQEWGVYAWFFKKIPDNVPTDMCMSKDGLTSVYRALQGEVYLTFFPSL